MSEECLICGAPLEYLETEVQMEYSEFSLCASYDQPHGPLARPYKTEPKQLTRPE